MKRSDGVRRSGVELENGGREVKEFVREFKEENKLEVGASRGK